MKTKAAKTNEIKAGLVVSGTSIAYPPNVKLPGPADPAISGVGHRAAKEQWL